MRYDIQIVPDIDDQQEKKKENEEEGIASLSDIHTELERKHVRSDNAVVLLRSSRQQQPHEPPQLAIPSTRSTTARSIPPVIQRINRDAQPLNEDEITALSRGNVVTIF